MQRWQNYIFGKAIDENGFTTITVLQKPNTLATHILGADYSKCFGAVVQNHFSLRPRQVLTLVRFKL